MKNWSLKKKVLVIGVLSVFGLGAIGAATPNPQSPPEIHNPEIAQPKVKSDKTEVKTETITESIPFETHKINDPSLANDTEIVKSEGKNGVKTKTWQVTYTNGVESSRTLVDENVTSQPVTKVISHGTKVALDCPNGTYTNSSGNEVCSPYQSPSAPDGATARCRDGSYSFSQHRSGTCSYHGGVAEWL